MKRSILGLSLALLTLNFVACNDKKESDTEGQKNDSNTHQKTENMNTHISIFEIPATDMSRAANFYQSILDIHIETMEMSGLEIGVFPFEGQMVTGVIMKGEGSQPSTDGVTVYLNGGDDLQIVLDRVEENGGQIIVPKTPHADESGFFALFLDSEGNKMGLHSVN